MSKNPILWMDYPDLDIIRVDDTYYMISTTMHFMPGGVILRSYDLVHWETAAYVYETLDDTPAQRLQGDENIYGCGMWAASLRYHQGMFYVCFVANDTHKTYLYTSKSIEGPWEKRIVEGFYHDCSLLFDGGRVFIVYGGRDIYLTELDAELRGPKPGGLHRLLVADRKEHMPLGYEGAHIYHIRGKYYLFLIHWPSDGHGRRTEACFVADDLEGAFRGGDVLDDDMGYQNAGVAQGGIVDTPEGDWYAMLFQDHGAVGRIPVLVPVRFEGDFPVFGDEGRVPLTLEAPSTRIGHRYAPLYQGDDFRWPQDEDGKALLPTNWQWNHNPQDALWSVLDHPGTLRVTTGKLCRNLTQAQNTLTQRMAGPCCEAWVTVDGSDLRIGDTAGLCALQGCYGLIGIRREPNGLRLVVVTRERQGDAISGTRQDTTPGTLRASVPLEGSSATLKLTADFRPGADTVTFHYRSKDGTWAQLGEKHQLHYLLDHFAGCRFGLFVYATEETGGTGAFSDFHYAVMEEIS